MSSITGVRSVDDRAHDTVDLEALPQEEQPSITDRYANFTMKYLWAIICGTLTVFIGIIILCWAHERSKFAALSLQMNDTNTALGARLAELEQKSADLKQLEGKAADLNRQLSDKSIALASFDAERQNWTTQQAAAQKRAADLNQLIAASAAETQTLKDLVAKLQASLDQAKSSTASPLPAKTASGLNADQIAKDASAKQELQDKLDQAQQKLKDTQKAEAEMASKWKEATDKLASGEKEFQKLQEEDTKMKAEKESDDKKIKDLEAQLKRHAGRRPGTTSP